MKVEVELELAVGAGDVISKFRWVTCSSRVYFGLPRLFLNPPRCIKVHF